MKKKSCGLIACLLAAVLLMGLLAGCAGSTTGQTAQDPAPAATDDGSASVAADNGQTEEEITFPLKETVEITIATEDGTIASLADNLPLWQEIQKRTNVKINWDVTAPAQYVEVMKLRVSAGGKLPDVMLLPNGLNLGELGGEGMIVPLEGYIEQYGENIQKMYEQFPRVQSLTSADGHIYSINTVSENAYFMPYCFIIRRTGWTDWGWTSRRRLTSG